uniref:isoleucine--tRNA ligase, cytoplasmic isoform X1 n=2 Tax=Myxine glutinosa TaxID=7769 RepID=UPI00358F330E
MVHPVPETINFPKEEEKILQLWEDLDAFQECLKQSKSRPRYTFYDGPPFATGLPHYGHILAGTIKDIVTRFAHQSGFYVERRFGWDCHGLPVEYEIDKTLNITGPEDVKKIGIAQYNAECRKIVMRYAKEWELTVKRLGRWIDFKNDYKTLYPWFMESVWWVFKQLFDKGFIYRSVKVMPFSIACHTPLSNFEANQNYKDVDDPAVIVSFPLTDEPTVALIAWTTTPWTLPSNLSICVNPAHTYIRVKDNATSKTYIMMEARLQALFKTPEEYTITDRFKGADLKGKTYIPLFEYFIQLQQNGAFRVLCDEYVTEESGTGVVHQAPYFGADDFRVCLENGIIQKDSTPICPVDSSGCFTSEVSDFVGMYVKDADKHIMMLLKERGRLVHSGTCRHNYPFCWRSDTPLIYKAVPSWFVQVKHMVDKLLKCNSQTYWVPDFVGEKRFGNWLRDAHDWALSRNRYWGTPIPLWVSDDFEEVVCIGSLQELEELTGSKVTDMHRESVDHLTIPSRCGKGSLRRVPEVLDCWFESGSMPYAQAHYPFTSRRDFQDSFPADFIAEGIDQTRGWFYTLLVLSTALFGKPAFKNCIVNGLVLASDGQKMSKRKKNYPDPLYVVNTYGADALRLYLINSPVVRAENLRFREESVRDVLKDVFLPWYNAYRFFVQNVQRWEQDEGTSFLYDERKEIVTENIMDKWIVSFMQSLIKYFKTEMAGYRLYTIVPRLVKFVDLLTNWYVRTNRGRLKGQTTALDCRHTLETLCGVLFSLCRLMAPFTPFITEMMFQTLRHFLAPSCLPDKDSRSIHYLMLPESRECQIDEQIEQAVARMQSIIELGRVIRDRNTIPMRYPLKEVVVIVESDEAQRDVLTLQKYILEELNVRTVTATADKSQYGVTLRAEPNYAVLGQRLKGAFKSVIAAIRNLKNPELENFRKTGSITVEGHLLGVDDLRLVHTMGQGQGNGGKYESHSDGQVLVLLNLATDQAMEAEGVAREVINRIQKLRKKAELLPTDEIKVYFEARPIYGYLHSIIQEHEALITSAIKAPLQRYPPPEIATIHDTAKVKDSDLLLTIVQKMSPAKPVLLGPVCAYLNLHLVADTRQQQAVALLENPSQDPVMDLVGLTHLACCLFGVDSCRLFSQGSELTADVDLRKLQGGCVLVTEGRLPKADVLVPSRGVPCCPYINVELLTACPAGARLMEEQGGADSGTNTKGINRGTGKDDCHKNKGSILLKNPFHQKLLDGTRLLHETAKVFGLRGRNLRLFLDSAKTEELTDPMIESSLNGKTLYLAVV